MWPLKEVLALKYKPMHHTCEDSSLNCCYIFFIKKLICPSQVEREKFEYFTIIFSNQLSHGLFRKVLNRKITHFP